MSDSVSRRPSRPSRKYELRRLQICAEEARGDVLDLGHAQLPNPYLEGARTIGLDLHAPRIPSGYSLDLRGSVSELSQVVGGRKFDTVIAGELIEHLERPYDFLRDVRATIQSGGRLVLSTPNPIGFPTLLLEIAQSRRWFYTSEHTYYYPPRWVRRLLERSGYRLVRTRSVGVWLPMGFIPWSPVWCSYQLVYVAELSSSG